MKRTRDPQKARQIVKVNAGGVIFATLLSTLTESFPDCLLAKQFNDWQSMPTDSDGHLFVDMSPITFGLILEILRNPVLVDMPPKDMPLEHFNALLKAQHLRPPDCEKKLAIREAWKQRAEGANKRDKQVLEMILSLIDLPALITGTEPSEIVYIPCGFKLDDGTDLALYILDSLEDLQTLLDDVSEGSATMNITNATNIKDSPASILFQGHTYLRENTPFYALKLSI